MPNAPVFSESVLSWFRLHINSTENIHVCNRREIFDTISSSSVQPLISNLLTSLKCPTRLQMIGHPARTCTCDSSAKSLPQSWSVLYSSGSLIRLVWSQEWAAVLWMYLATGPPPAPPCCHGKSIGSVGNPGLIAELFLPIRTLCTKALKQPPLWHDDNVQFHTASWRLTVYYVCKVFFWKWWSWILWLLCNFCRLWKSIKVYIAVNTNRKPNISMKTARTYITYFEIYFLCWF